jgi:hypothetical protein
VRRVLDKREGKLRIDVWERWFWAVTLLAKKSEITGLQ